MRRRGARSLLKAHIRTVMNDQLITVAPDTSLVDVAREIAAHGIGAVPVVDKRRKLVGIISSSDLVAFLHDGGDLEEKLARDVMTRELVAIDEFAPAEEAIGLIRTAKILYLPVVRAGKLVGMVGASDLMRHLLQGYPAPDIA
jgi:CBS domain-containing protein